VDRSLLYVSGISATAYRDRKKSRGTSASILFGGEASTLSRRIKNATRLAPRRARKYAGGGGVCVWACLHRSPDRCKQLQAGRKMGHLTHTELLHLPPYLRVSRPKAGTGSLPDGAGLSLQQREEE
jgi:hypothetical protein